MVLKRRRQQKTDYRQRLALLKSGMHRLVIRRNHNSIHIQFIASEETGDRTIFETSSKSLAKLGWKGHGGNIPSSYLTGYMAGTEASKKGIREAVVDTGLQNSVKFSNIYAAAAGAKDAGIRTNIGGSVVPDKNRMSGKHVADYAAKLKKENNEAYKKQFSGYIKKGVSPEDLPKHFEEIKSKIRKVEEVSA